MKDTGSLSHTKWECKYHVVFIPKYRHKAMYKELRQYLGEIFHELARQKESRIKEGHLCSDPEVLNLDTQLYKPGDFGRV